MEPEQPFHTEAMLLPGYVNKTLSPEEEQQVTNHLKGCVTCQQELQEVNNMQAAIKSSIAQRPGPSPAAFPTLMRRIEQEKQAQQRQASQPTTTSWWQTVEAAFRSLFEIQWVPALASVLIAWAVSTNFT
jgi:anti-sigma factor RsiW